MSYNLQTVLDDLVNNIATDYLSPDISKNLTSTFGHINMALAKSIRDSGTLAENRALDDVIELSTNEEKLRAAAKIRGISIDYNTPSSAVFGIILRISDILNSPKVNDEYQVYIDRKSMFTVNELNFSLNDDLLLRLRKLDDSEYRYTVSFVGGNEENVYLQTSIMQLDDGSEGIAIFVRAFQYAYKDAINMITDAVEFTYNGIGFDYDDKLAGFKVEYRSNTTEDFKEADLLYYRSDEKSSTALYYNDDRDGVIYILNNSNLGIAENGEIKVTVKETKGIDGNFTVGNHSTIFEIYENGVESNYIGNQSDIITDAISGKDGPTTEEIRTMLITNRWGIVGIDPNNIKANLGTLGDDTVEIDKKNDIEARVTNNYTLLRDTSNIVIPTRTIDLRYVLADFDTVHGTTARKVIKANNIFTLNASNQAYKTNTGIDIPAHESDVTKLALNVPMMAIISQDDYLTYYSNSIDDVIQLAYDYSSDYQYQFFSTELSLQRYSLEEVDNDTYKIKLKAIPNTPDNISVKNDLGVILDADKLKVFMRIFDVGGNTLAYAVLDPTSFDIPSSQYIFEGNFKTNDYISETNLLQITEGLKEVSTGLEFTDVIPYDQFNFDLIFAYKEDPTETTHSAYSDILEMSAYTITNSYKNIDSAEIIKNMSGYMQSAVVITDEDDGQGGTETVYTIKEVPFIKYSYMKENISLIYDQMKNVHDSYTPIVTNLKDSRVNVKFISTYGKSENIDVLDTPLNNLMPTLSFRIYGTNVDVDAVRTRIIEYLHSFAAESSVIYITNLITTIEKEFSSIQSLEYLGVDAFGPGYQKFTNDIPDIDSMTQEELLAHIPEYLNIQTISIEVKEA